MEKIIQKENDGFIYTIKNIEIVDNLECSHSCHLYDIDCSYIKNCAKFGISSTNKKFSCIKVLINVKNIGSFNDWIVGSEDILMVDSEGYSYKGMVLCNEMVTFRIAEDRTKILPGTQIDYIELFPKLPDGVTYSKFVVNVHHSWCDFVYAEEALTKTIESHKASDLHDGESVFHKGINIVNNEIKDFKQQIIWLKADIFSCLNNELTNTAIVKMENDIRKKIYTIMLTIEDKEDPCFKTLYNQLTEIEKDFSAKVKKRRNSTGREAIAQKIDELLALDPRQFEEYIGQLYKSKGFTTEVTPYSNDKGVDIIMFKDSVKYVVQCKKYKGTVGSPDIQKFIGAMDHAQADKGIFVTTGLFSFEAEKMAKEHPIVLVNRIDLAKLILEELG